ncbi:hypothetical protein [Kribbella sp. VKM Ac-2500]|nr:hypothetical protein [Kribbella sp. VKM Ac-2500]
MSVAADWLAAVGTIGAFAVSLRLLAVDLDTRRKEQASLVAAWLGGDPQTWENELRLRVSNQSQQPVFGLTAFVETVAGRRLLRDVGLVPSRRGNSTPFFEIGGIAGLGPGVAVRGVSIQFTDAAGRRWCREFDGRLRRIKD